MALGLPPLQIHSVKPNTPMRLQVLCGSAMSRAHAVAPLVGVEAPYRAPDLGVTASGPRRTGRRVRPQSSCYLERALLLWPRLDRSKLRKIADDPKRMAEVIEKRTSLPFDSILAVLTRQNQALAAVADVPRVFEPPRADGTRVSLRIVRSEEGSEIQVQDLLPA